MRNGLYYLVNTLTNSENQNTASELEVSAMKSVKQDENSLSLWHNRLGHASIARLKNIPSVKPYTSQNLQVCISCPMAKFTKPPYTLSDSHAASPFDLIHMDICGPYKVSTKGKYRYFLTIVDDHSRNTWVYLLQFKSESLSTFESFYNYAHTHFGKSIKVIRSDNALEFHDGPCQKFFAKMGIIHQTSCVKRPQQNARVERKHRNVLEMSKALRFHAGLPLSYWGECVLTAVHLTNRIPTPILGNKTPYECLHLKLPEYSHLKVFGCLAFAYNPDRISDKFDPRGVPCVFLGYPATEKGYRLQNLITKQYFVSRDVLFHEHIFPFHKNSQNS